MANLTDQPTALRQRRLDLGLSTSQLAYRLGRSQSSVVRLEQSEAEGRISVALLRQVAAALGCALSYELRPLRTDGSPALNRNSLAADRFTPRSKSGISSKLSSTMPALARRLSFEQRLSRAFELSDFSRALVFSPAAATKSQHAKSQHAKFQCKSKR